MFLHFQINKVKILSREIKKIQPGFLYNQVYVESKIGNIMRVTMGNIMINYYNPNLNHIAENDAYVLLRLY